MSNIIVIPIGSAPPVRKDALQDAVLRRQAAEDALSKAIPQHGDGTVLLMSERLALRRAMLNLSRLMAEEETELSRIARRRAIARLGGNGGPAA
ncbi:hypothetical protein [Novacetimonas hansenii]|uniref:Uncharacterized protein n=1 Tax=Novacetimonas hansenii TaxID=436 RepID=A0AAW5ELL5_NOVHA|nr:hypothetical protein [Novacetimonas hansenii]MCJ8352726.1 hypothetical protein [Novacetimonas hansenii]